jgi:hypothetical protein
MNKLISIEPLNIPAEKMQELREMMADPNIGSYTRNRASVCISQVF